MRKSILLMAALLAAVVVAPGAAWSQEEGGARGPEESVVHHLRGSVVSVDADAGTLQVRLAPPPRHGRRGPREGGERRGPQSEGQSGQDRSGPTGAVSRRRARTVTVKTDGSTRVRRNRAASSLSALQARDKVDVLIVTDEETTLTQALSEAAEVVAAKTPPARTQS